MTVQHTDQKFVCIVPSTCDGIDMVVIGYVCFAEHDGVHTYEAGGGASNLQQTEGQLLTNGPHHSSGREQWLACAYHGEQHPAEDRSKEARQPPG